MMLVARKPGGRVAKCIFDQIEANLAEIQPKNHQNVQKMHFFCKKLQESNMGQRYDEQPHAFNMGVAL